MNDIRPLSTPTRISGIAGLLAALRDFPCEPFASIFYVDVRHLRVINRIAGPEEGDAVIERVTLLLQRWVGVAGVAGRLWSNEFIAVRNIDHPQYAVDAGLELGTQLAELEYHCSTGSVPLAASIGVAVVRTGEDWLVAMTSAATACEQAKARGLNQISVFGPATKKPDKAVVNRACIEEFRRLLAAGKLSLHPQPIMDIRRPEAVIAKAEYLLRMERNGVYMPVPAGTIETLEYYGLGSELDRFSSTFLLDWLADNPRVLDRLHSVSFNLSARSLGDAHFMDGLLREVKSAHLPPGKLCFEITETAAIERLEVAAEVMQVFRAAGCRFSLDDFGSGLCSFGYLQSLVVDEVKIDGRFIRDVAQDGSSQQIVRAIHQVARATGKFTVAEFVDDPRKLTMLREIGVDYAQGWLFYPAVPPEKFLELLGVG